MSVLLADSSGSANFDDCNELLKSKDGFAKMYVLGLSPLLCKADVTTGRMQYTSGSPMISNGRPDRLCPPRQLA